MIAIWFMVTILGWVDRNLVPSPGYKKMPINKIFILNKN